MKEKTKKKLKIAVVVYAAFMGLMAIAKMKKSNSIYDDELEQKNPMEGKMVQFIEDENDSENADGVKGHLIEIDGQAKERNFYDRYVKRCIDIVFSFGGLVLLSPIYVVIALAIKIDDPGPVLFTQKRVGQNKQYFKLHKFRSMKMSTPHDIPTHMLEDPEQYITKVGKFLRKSSLDELPQIWDIFIGNMSIIGPRPALWNQDCLTSFRDQYGANNVKPGLTGWAQINGRDELNLSVKAQLDGEYVDKQSLLFDIKCFLGTIKSVIKSDGIIEGGTGELNKDYEEKVGFQEEITLDVNQKKKILITGANSYIGTSFEEYAKKNYKDNFIIDTLDMMDESWENYSFSRYDTVLHVAGIAHADVGNVSEKTKQKYYRVNRDLVIKTAKKAKNEGVKQFIYMSSIIIYGESASYGNKKVITKYTKPKPANFYGDSKWQGDQGVRELGDDKFNVVVVRPPMIYGKNSKGNYPVLSKLAKKLPVFPNINNERSMLHIDNLCEFLCKVILIGKGGIFFPQNKEYTKTVDMVKEISYVSNKKIKITVLFNPIVFLLSKIPGKVSKLVNKAFGSLTYDQSMSEYNFDYRVVDLKESIVRIEDKNEEDVKEKFNTKNTLNKINTLQNFDSEINVFVIGLRGYTQNYGGWEAFAHGLLDNWRDDSIHFYAFEKVDEYSKEEIVEVNGITCIRICEKETGSSAMMKYDKNCTDFTCEFVKKNRVKNPVMFHLGVRIGPYLWFKRKQIKKLGIKMMENPAGAEWRRTKWNKLVQAYLWISAVMMAKSTDCMTCDNEGIKELYNNMLVGRKPKLEYVAYGVSLIPPVEKEMPQKVADYFNQWDIEKDGYYLVLGRFIPENNYEMMLKGFIQSISKRKLLVICNYKTEIQSFYEHIKKSTEFENDNRVIMAGTLYDLEILHYIRQYAHGYIHGHSVGGTNPGLLEGMVETDVNILYNVNFNRYVGGTAALYFSNKNELSEQINYVDNISMEEKKQRGQLAKEIMRKKYSWEYIVKEYNRIIHEVVD